jgi:pimeloyl-ACP methyl ester carboxylesterase
MNAPVGSVSRRELLAGSLAAMAATTVPSLLSAAAPSGRAPMVLVHGAWHGGWCWRRVADRLTAKGRYVTAPTLTGLGERSHLASDAIDLSTHIDDVANEIKWKDLDGIVLVGHSYGGMVITGVAERMRERIAAIVYLDAFIPKDGQSVADMRGPNATPFREPFAPPPPAAAFHVNAKDAAWVDSKVTPQPTKCMTEKLKVTGAYQTVAHKTYLRALDFPNVGFDDSLARCKADPTWKTMEMKWGHDIMIDHPAELVAILDRIG